jgi:hypothetical protein
VARVARKASSGVTGWSGGAIQGLLDYLIGGTR